MDHERNPPEYEFAACLLSCGGPDRLRPAGTTVQKKSGSHHTYSEPITSADYMFKCCDWYDKNIEDAESHGFEFAYWWTKYKVWLWENRRGT